MNNTIYGDLMVMKLDTTKYALGGLEEEPLSRRELILVLNKVLKVPVEEIAFAFEDFRLNPEYRRAYFGALNGAYLYSK